MLPGRRRGASFSGVWPIPGPPAPPNQSMRQRERPRRPPEFRRRAFEVAGGTATLTVTSQVAVAATALRRAC